jgi:hypothetical protein
MKTLDKDELYQNLQGFLKTKGIELKEGSYAQGIQKSCTLLAEAINASQKGLSKAKVGIDKKLDQMRQVIHEKTAPPGSSAAPPKAETPSPNQGSAPKTEGKKPHARKNSKAKKPRP